MKHSMLTSCCCGCSLRSGVFFIAILEALGAAGLSIVVIINLEDATSIEIDEYFVIGFIAVVVINCCIMAVAAWKRVVPLLWIAAVIQFLVTAVILLAAILIINDQQIPYGVGALIITLICFYFFLVIVSFSREINDLAIATTGEKTQLF